MRELEELVLVDRPRQHEALLAAALHAVLPVRAQIVDVDRELAPEVVEQRLADMPPLLGGGVRERRVRGDPLLVGAASSSSDS